MDELKSSHQKTVLGAQKKHQQDLDQVISDYNKKLADSEEVSGVKCNACL